MATIDRFLSTNRSISMDDFHYFFLLPSKFVEGNNRIFRKVIIIFYNRMEKFKETEIENELNRAVFFF
jgi:hypothetical protein